MFSTKPHQIAHMQHDRSGIKGVEWICTREGSGLSPSRAQHCRNSQRSATARRAPASSSCWACSPQHLRNDERAKATTQQLGARSPTAILPAYAIVRLCANEGYLSSCVDLGACKAWSDVPSSGVVIAYAGADRCRAKLVWTSRSLLRHHHL